MLEILLIVNISKKIRFMTNEKGYNSTLFIVLFVFLWFAFELSGFVVGLIITESELAGYIFGLIGAAIGGTIGWAVAKLSPDKSQQQ